MHKKSRKLSAALLAGATMVGVLYPTTASAQTVHDIEVRDKLIADQQALLDEYRCRFDIDTEAVDGGCTSNRPAIRNRALAPMPESPTTEDIGTRDKKIADLETTLNFYRCMFSIETQEVSGGCADEAVWDTETDDLQTHGTWTPYEGYLRNHPSLSKPLQNGVFVESTSSEGLSEATRAELHVACHYFDSDTRWTLRVYINWNRFITPQISIYNLNVELPHGETRDFSAINSTVNEASYLIYADGAARFTQMIADLDGEAMTASVFLPFTGETISATFDLAGAADAVQSTLESCPAQPHPPSANQASRSAQRLHHWNLLV